MNSTFRISCIALLLAFSPGTKAQETPTTANRLEGKTIRAMCQNPKSLGTFYVGLKGKHLGDGFLYSTNNAPGNWAKINQDKPLRPHVADIQALAASPHHGQTLLAGTWKNGLFKSEDNGISWDRMWYFPSNDVRSIQFGYQNPELVYVATSSHGIVKTNDRCRSWKVCTPATINASFQFAWSVVVDPHNDSIVYAATFGQGVFKSTDQGENWQKVLDTKGMVCWDMLVSAGSGKIWAAASGQGDSTSNIFTSTDGGDSWETMTTVPQKGLCQIQVIESKKEDILFVGSWRGGSYQYEKGKWTHLALVDYPTISEILVNKEQVVFGTWGNGVYALPNKWTSRYKIENIVPPPPPEHHHHDD